MVSEENLVIHFAHIDGSVGGLFCINDKYIAYAISTATVLFLKYYVCFPGKGDNRSEGILVSGLGLFLIGSKIR
jgi:hypothetical protein